MQAFELTKLLVECARSEQPWCEFLRVPLLSMGLYCLKVGQLDQQKPHTEDEVYLVVSGKASFRAGERIQPVVPGTILFVERGLEHRFFDVTEDLTLLVFFAPAEGSRNDEPLPG